MRSVSKAVMLCATLVSMVLAACIAEDPGDDALEDGDEETMVVADERDEAAADATAPKAIAPSCVERQLNDDEDELLVRNRCSTEQWVKVIIAWGPDHNCTKLARNEPRIFGWLVGSFDRLERC